MIQSNSPFRLTIIIYLIGGMLLLITPLIRAAEQLLWESSGWPSVSNSIPILKIYAEFDQFHATTNEEITLLIRGFLEEGWHIYSVHQQGENGPRPTTVTYPSLMHQIVGPIEESEPQIIEDQALNLKLAVHKHEFILKQRIKISSLASPGPQNFEGILHYQICDNNICAPLQHHPFSTPLTIK